MRRLTNLIPLALALALLLALPACGGASRTEFAADVRDSRDRVDAALARVTEATSFDELLELLRDAADETRAAADDIEAADRPDDLDRQADELAEAYRALGGELDATAEALDEVTTEELGYISGLEFENWKRVQRALAALRREGIEVQPLERH